MLNLKRIWEVFYVYISLTLHIEVIALLAGISDMKQCVVCILYSVTLVHQECVRVPHTVNPVTVRYVFLWFITSACNRNYRFHAQKSTCKT